MRPTTKIIFGVIASIFILSLSFIIGFSFSERRHYTGHYHTANRISIPQENPIGVNLDPHRVIVIEEDYTGVRFEDENKPGTARINMYLESGCLSVIHKTSEMDDKLYFPEALIGCIATKMNDDTLTIQLKYSELLGKYDKGDSLNYISFSGIDLDLHTSIVNIVNRVPRCIVKVNTVETDSIQIDSRGEVLIESCKANFIYTLFSKLTVKNCVVKTILLDLDHRGSWKIEKSDIEFQNFTGSGQHNITQYRNESSTINWYPKNAKAELNIKVPGDTTQIVFR